MAIAFDAATAGPNTTAASASLSHTCSGSDRYLVVGIGCWASGVTISGVTYNGAALTQIAAGTHEGSNGRQELWGLIAPASGTHDIVVTFSGSCEHGVGAVSYTGVHQTAATGTPATASGNSSAPTVDVSSATGELVVDVVSAFNTTFAQGSGQTERWDLGNSGGIEEAAASEEAGAATVTMSWSLGATRQWGITAIPLKPSSGSLTVTDQAVLVATVADPTAVLGSLTITDQAQVAAVVVDPSVILGSLAIGDSAQLAAVVTDPAVVLGSVTVTDQATLVATIADPTVTDNVTGVPGMVTLAEATPTSAAIVEAAPTTGTIADTNPTSADLIDVSPTSLALAETLPQTATLVAA